MYVAILKPVIYLPVSLEIRKNCMAIRAWEYKNGEARILLVRPAYSYSIVLIVLIVFVLKAFLK